MLRPLELAGALDGLELEPDVAGLRSGSPDRWHMPELVLATCLILVVTSVVAFVRSHRKGSPMGSLIGLAALVIAGIPAAAYGAMTSF